MRIKAFALTGLIASALVFGFTNSAGAIGASNSGAYGKADFYWWSKNWVDIQNLSLRDKKCDGRPVYMYFSVKYKGDGSWYKVGTNRWNKNGCNTTVGFSDTYFKSSSYNVIHSMKLTVCAKTSPTTASCVYTISYNPYR